MSETPARYTVNAQLAKVDADVRTLRLRATVLSRQLDDLLAGKPVGDGITADYLAVQLGQVKGGLAVLEEHASKTRDSLNAPPAA